MSNNNPDKKRLSEFELIRHLTNNIKITNKETIYGIGDDAAVLEYTDKQTVVTTDLLIEGIHFDLAYVPLKHLGYKAAVVNFSDVYAMNAVPKQLVISIAISNRFSQEAVEELYSGLKLACNNYHVDLVGGDTSASPKGMFLSLTAIGSATKGNIVYRKNAEDGDLICVSGDLGAAYMGLQLLKRENELFKADPDLQPVLTGYDYILQRQLKPEARPDVIEFFNKEKIIPSSMIDISDGLSSEILHICKNSNVGCKLFEDKIPIANETAKMAKELGIDPLICALDGGEDYELLFTIKQKDYDKIKPQSGISVIGHITHKSAGTNIISTGGNIIPLQAKGWNAFANKDSN
ncbi:MAG: thiamine-phosphate kinase [Bacteroidetes bacterium]|nr:MAG: thiamine-phosphate kinase [Bacteroidota bacterium]